MNANNVGSRYPDSFGNFVIATAVPVPLNAVSNAAAVMSVVGTSYIVRRVTISNANATATTATAGWQRIRPRRSRFWPWVRGFSQWVGSALM